MSCTDYLKNKHLMPQTENLKLVLSRICCYSSFLQARPICTCTCCNVSVWWKTSLVLRVLFWVSKTKAPVCLYLCVSVRQLKIGNNHDSSLNIFGNVSSVLQKPPLFLIESFCRFNTKRSDVDVFKERDRDMREEQQKQQVNKSGRGVFWTILPLFPAFPRHSVTK